VGGVLDFTGAVTNYGTILVPTGAEALFSDLSASATIELSGGTVDTAGTAFASSGNITGSGIVRTGGLTNSGTIALAGESSVFGAVTNSVGGAIQLSGIEYNNFFGAVANSGTFFIDAGSTASVYAAYSGSGSLVDNGSLYLSSNSSTGKITGTGVLTIGQTAAPAVLQLAASSGASTIGTLSVAGSSKLDIANNQMFITYGNGPDPIASIAAMIASGYAGGAWNGSGIISSSAQSNSGSYGIGYADSADPGNPANLPSGTIEIMYTLLGDANLDGKVNGIDFNLMATNFNQAVTDGWDKGDFNYDGKVNGSDFVLLADNFNQFASQSDVSAADLLALDSFATTNGINLTNVPEPASAGMMLVAGLGILRRRLRASR
jgi:hypothetical protein